MTLSLVNVTTGSSFGVPGPASVRPYNSLGNLLVLFAVWNVSAAVTSGSPVVPAGSVADSSENWWRAVADTGSSVPGCRAAAWICSNALVISRWLSFCPQGYVSSFVYLVAEMSGAPASYWPLIDFATPASSTSSSALSPGGTATVADYCFSMAGAGSTTPVITGPGSGWTSLGTGSVGGVYPNSSQIAAAYGAFGAGAVAAAWNYSVAGQVAAATFGLTQANNLPVQINPNFPQVFVEAALGATPGDPTVAILDTQYTDLSSYAISEAGQVSIDAGYGRQYELAQPESGTTTIGMNNQSGAFNPANTSSPFYPYIKVGVPVRTSAQFSGRRYPISQGYVERWPQDWPDMPQWGWSKLIATDAVGVASSANLPSAVQGEILADNPYLCLPFSEQYTTSQSTVNGVQATAVSADGLFANNTAPDNQQVGTYISGPVNGTGFNPAVVGSDVMTGQTLGLLGDSGTGMGASGYQAVDTSGQNGPGAQYGPDPGLPLIAANGAGDAAMECWFLMPEPPSGAPGSYLQRLISLFVEPALTTVGTITTIQNAGTFLYMFALPYSGGALYLRPSWTNLNAFGELNYGGLNHAMAVIENGVVSAYINGVFQGTITGVPLPSQLVYAAFGEATGPWGSLESIDANYNYSMAYGTIYSYAPSASRIATHYQSGFSGFSGDSFLQRAARYLAWGRLNLGLAGPSTADHVQLGPAYSTANSPAASALNADALSTGGVWFANRSGNLVVLPRQELYDLPSSVTFGDNVAAGEVPYLPAAGFDYDNTYLQNVVQATQVQGPSTLAAPVVRSPSSVDQYFQRGPLTQQADVATAQDAVDRANWSLNKYQQPALRVRTLEVDAASHPAAFPAILSTGLANAATVNRRPLGQSSNSYSLPVMTGKIQHSIGPGVWKVTYQAYPYVPEGAVLCAGWSFTVSGTPSSGSYFIATAAQAATINVGDTFTDVSNPGTTFTVTQIGPPSGGFQNVSIAPAAGTVIGSPDVVTQAGSAVLGSNALAW